MLPIIIKISLALQWPMGNAIPIDRNIWEGEGRLDENDNLSLCTPFSELEIKEALLQMEHNKAAGPDCIPVEFYQSCWGIVKHDTIEIMFDDFYHGRLDM